VTRRHETDINPQPTGVSMVGTVPKAGGENCKVAEAVDVQILFPVVAALVRIQASRASRCRRLR
jgi:hypothetical protein